MYAIVRTGGKQYKVAPGDKLNIEKIDAEVGSKVSLDTICVVDGSNVEADPIKASATKVEAVVLSQFKGEKQLVFKFKKRKNYKKLHGHRQQLTCIEIESVGGVKAEPKVKTKTEAACGSKTQAKDNVDSEIKSQAKDEAKAEASDKAKSDAELDTKSEVMSSADDKENSTKPSDVDAAQDLDALKVADLKEIAEKLNVKTSGLKKTEIIEAIRAAQK